MPFGAGQSGAGQGGAGFAPGPGASGAATTGLPAALLYDPATRDFRLNSDGTFAGVDPVDQEVAIALSFAKGALGSVPDAGNEIRTMDRLGGPGFQGKVLDIVNRALAAPIARGAITVMKVEIDAKTVRGRLYLAVTYVNNNLASPQAPQTVRAPLV